MNLASNLHEPHLSRILWAALMLFLLVNSLHAQEAQRPNVILIMTDDQGYGDLGITGNPHVKTPVIDQLARESVAFKNFYVSPVCAPTRSSLMTGRYSLRTGIRDTYNGGAIMASSELTLAELLKEADYKTGIFGKWHLGDNYPSRPMDQGFDESVIHLAGGMGQVGDITTYFQRDRSYFDPVLWHNGQQQAYEGYCSDIFTDEAMGFIEQNKDAPFFCYLSFNAPHTPLQVPDKYYQAYKDIDPSAGFEDDDRPFVEMSEKDKEDARKVYAMVSNIDENLGRLFRKVEDLDLSQQTIIIFMTDNGPQQTRYVAGLRGRKSSVYRGGIRVPFYLKYPSLSDQPENVAALTAHIDVLPTIAELCHLDLPQDRIIDGQSLVPFLNGNPSEEDRSLFFYWTRKYPELYRNIAFQKGPYKLVGNADYDAPIESFELYNLAQDPYEQTNILLTNKKTAEALKAELDQKYEELIQSENLVNPPRIELGSPQENPTFLSRNDATGERGIWAQEEIHGYWKVRVDEGRYNIRFKFIKPVKGGGQMYLETNERIYRTQNEEEATDLIELKNIHLPEMDCDFLPFYSVEGKKIFPFWAEVERLD